MAIGLEKDEIETLVKQVIQQYRDRPKREVFGQDPALPIWMAVSEAISQNNAKIYEALAKAGIKI